jgi:hypothetical protein
MRTVHFMALLAGFGSACVPRPYVPLDEPPYWAENAIDEFVEEMSSTEPADGTALEKVSLTIGDVKRLPYNGINYVSAELRVCNEGTGGKKDSVIVGSPESITMLVHRRLAEPLWYSPLNQQEGCQFFTGMAMDELFWYTNQLESSARNSATTTTVTNTETVVKVDSNGDGVLDTSVPVVSQTTSSTFNQSTFDVAMRKLKPLVAEKEKEVTEFADWACGRCLQTSKLSPGQCKDYAVLVVVPGSKLANSNVITFGVVGTAKSTSFMPEPAELDY